MGSGLDARSGLGGEKGWGCDVYHRRVLIRGFRMELLEDSRMPLNSLPEAAQESLPTPCSCAGPCAGYGTRTGCPSLLVLATLDQAKKELAALLNEEAAA